jgi:hypothetical protein
MATKSQNPVKNIDTEEMIDRVAIGATRVAMVAGVVALGAAFLAGPQTKQKIGRETTQAMESLRGLMQFFRVNAEKAQKHLEE